MSHVAKRSTYYLVFLALMAETANKVAVTYIELGRLNTPVALAPA